MTAHEDSLAELLSRIKTDFDAVAVPWTIYEPSKFATLIEAFVLTQNKRGSVLVRQSQTALAFGDGNSPIRQIDHAIIESRHLANLATLAVYAEDDIDRGLLTFLTESGAKASPILSRDALEIAVNEVIATARLTDAAPMNEFLAVWEDAVSRREGTNLSSLHEAAVALLEVARSVLEITFWAPHIDRPEAGGNSSSIYRGDLFFGVEHRKAADVYSLVFPVQHYLRRTVVRCVEGAAFVQKEIDGDERGPLTEAIEQGFKVFGKFCYDLECGAGTISDQWEHCIFSLRHLQRAGLPVFLSARLTDCDPIEQVKIIDLLSAFTLADHQSIPLLAGYLLSPDEACRRTVGWLLARAAQRDDLPVLRSLMEKAGPADREAISNLIQYIERRTSAETRTSGDDIDEVGKPIGPATFMTLDDRRAILNSLPPSALDVIRGTRVYYGPKDTIIQATAFGGPTWLCLTVHPDYTRDMAVGNREGLVGNVIGRLDGSIAPDPDRQIGMNEAGITNADGTMTRISLGGGPKTQE